MGVFMLIIFLLSKKVLSFNFDLDFPIIFNDPEVKNNRTYFGYTSAMYAGNNVGNKQWIRIGSPKALNINKKSIGTVYDCDVYTGCKRMKFINKSIQKALWENDWIGGTMDISYSSQRLAVCGFHHIYIIGKDYRTMGTCFWTYLNSSIFQSIPSLLDYKKSTISVSGVTVYQYGQGEAGFSAHFPEIENELILGAPGVFNWAGTPFRVRDVIYQDPEPNRRRKRYIEPFSNVEIPLTEKNDAFNFFGYSVTSGYYYDSNSLYYVASSPLANVYTGKVVIFKFTSAGYLINEKETKIGQNFGEYFGASLATGKLNNDKYDDLLVGSPYYSEKTYNEGKVYVFLGDKTNLKNPLVLTGNNKGALFGAAIMFLGDLNRDGFGDVAIGAPFENENSGAVYIYKGNSEGLQMTPFQKIIGREIYPSLKGFGISISKGADMDGNGYKDISIGAHLSRNLVLLRSKPLVIIRYHFSSTPKVLKQETRNFSIELSFLYEMFNEKSVDLSYTVSVDNILGRATIANSKNNSISKNITIFQNEIPLIESIPITIKNFTDLDVRLPIKVSVRYDLNYPVFNKTPLIVPDKMSGKDVLCIRCPVLDYQRSNQTFFETEVPFTLDCGLDNECQSELSVNVQFPGLSKDTFVLGSSNYLKLQATVENKNENAYSTKLFLVLPETVYFRQTPPKCKSVNASALVCDVANPLPKGQQKQFLFDLDVKNINENFNSSYLSFYSKILTDSQNLNPDTKVISLKLSREADIMIYGTTQQEINYYGDASNNKSILTQIYKVEKFGFSPLKKLRVTLEVPFKYKTIDNENLAFLGTSGVDAYFGGQPMTCNFIGISVKKRTNQVEVDESNKRRRRDVDIFKTITNETHKENLKINNEEVKIANKTLYLNCSSSEVTCFTVNCEFGPYDKKVPASIHLNMIVNLTALADIAKTMDMVLISSKGLVEILLPSDFIQNGDREDSVIISSIFLNDVTKVKPVALWVIIVGVIMGLLMLLLLILLCIKVGFFKRSKKEELESLKAAAIQEDKIRENIRNSQNQEAENEIIEEDSPFDGQVTSSKEDLCEPKEK